MFERPLRGNLLSRLRRPAASRLSPAGFDQAYKADREFTGKSVYLGDGVWWRVAYGLARRNPDVFNLPTRYDP